MPQTIDLINNLYIKVDGLNNTVLLRTNNFDKNGKMVPQIIGYASDLGSALKIAYRYCINNGLNKGITTLEEAIKLMTKCEKELFKALKENK